ncbi:N-acetyltransferase family protein [Pseudomonas sp. HK3]
MTIRNYHPNDYPAIADIYNASKLDELKFEDNHYQLLPLDLDAKRQFNLLNSTIFVYDDALIKGYSAVNGNTIQSLFVHPDFRGLGIGRALLAFALQGIDGNATLQVVKSNIPSKTLYRAYGFSDIEESEANYNGVNVTINTMLRRR